MEQKIRIAEVITRLDWGGSPDIVRLICTSLDPDKFDVKLITGTSAYPSSETKKFLKSFKDKTIHINQLKRNIDPINDLAALIKLYCLFRKEKFDIVHTHTAKAGALGRIAARLAGIPYIVHTPHGHNFYGYFGPIMSKIIVMIEKIIAHFSDRIIALTELEKNDLTALGVSQPTKISVINNAIELDKLKNVKTNIIKKRGGFSVGSNESLVGMICRLEPVKGPGYFIEAAKFVIERFPKVKFLVVGEGSLRKKLESRCKNLGIFDKFIFAGWREDIPEILFALDILVAPSLNEAFGRILIEGGACGIPVVATNVGGIPEIVNNNQTGILVPPRDSHKLAGAIISLLENRERRERMSEATRRWVDDKFSVERMINRISNLYQESMRNEKNQYD